MTKLLVFTFVLMTSSLFAQKEINTTVNGIEYLRFELEDRLGNSKSPAGGGSYYLRINGNIAEYELEKRIQLNKREIGYSSPEARSLGVFWLVFEFRNNEHTCFILNKYVDYKFVITDKIIVENSETTTSSIFHSCEQENQEDEQIFALHKYDGDVRTVQYLNDIWKAWRADTTSGILTELQADKIRCLSNSYWDYEGDDKSIPSWYHSGMVGVINDPDGYTNVRSRPHGKSRVIYKMMDAVEFRYWPDPKYEWWKVHYWPDDMKKPVNGFIHKSRIKKK